MHNWITLRLPCMSVYLACVVIVSIKTQKRDAVDMVITSNFSILNRLNIVNLSDFLFYIVI